MGDRKESGGQTDPYTGKTPDYMNKRHADIYKPDRLQAAKRERAEILNSVLRHGAHGEKAYPTISSLAINMHTDDYTMQTMKRRAAVDAEQPVEQVELGKRDVHDSTLGISFVAAVRTP